MLECTGLDFYYGAAHRLKDVSFSAEPGALIGLFGRNGAGKTTLLKMLGGTLPIRSGQFRLFGKPAVDDQGYLRTDLRRDFAVLFQGTSSDEKLSAYYNLAYGARLMGVPSAKIDEVVRRTLTFADLADRAHEPIKKYSGGMRRRLELYRSFMHSPRVVLLDEPTAGLDVLESQKFFSFLKDYQKRNQAVVIMSTHRPEEAINSDRVIMMTDGVILADRSPNDLILELNYLCCSLALEENFDPRGLFSSIFDVVLDNREGMMRAKLPISELDAFLKSPCLRDQKIKAFAIEKPTIADAYHDLCRRMGEGS